MNRYFISYYFQKNKEMGWGNAFYNIDRSIDENVINYIQNDINKQTGNKDTIIVNIVKVEG